MIERGQIQRLTGTVSNGGIAVGNGSQSVTSGNPARPGIPSGRMATPLNTGALGSFSHATTSMYACAVYLEKRYNITGLAFGVTTSASALNVKLGVYTNVNGMPGTLIAGTAITGGPYTDGAATSHTVAFGAPIGFDPDWYWAVIQTDQTVTLNGTGTTMPQMIIGAADMITVGGRVSALNSYAAGLPASFGTPTITNASGMTYVGMVVQ